jgi:hypothetical protein
MMISASDRERRRAAACAWLASNPEATLKDLHFAFWEGRVTGRPEPPIGRAAARRILAVVRTTATPAARGAPRPDRHRCPHCGAPARGGVTGSRASQETGDSRKSRPSHR